LLKASKNNSKFNFVLPEQYLSRRSAYGGVALCCLRFGTIFIYYVLP